METRRNFLTHGLLELLKGASEPARPAPVRPPGALPEREFLNACTRCDDCVPACPHEAIRKAGIELGADVVGTPVIAALEQPCWMCADLPCIAACATGALAPLPSPEAARMGSLRVSPAACFSAMGSPCEVCEERCPVRPKPIGVKLGEAPRLAEDGCTGCGVCAWLCPADALAVVG